MADSDVFGPRSINAFQAGRVGYVESFARVPGINADITIAFNPDFEILGTAAVSADVAFNAEGGITLSTHGGATDSTILLPHLDTAQSNWKSTTWGTDQQTHWGCTIRTPAALTNTTFWAGLKLTNTPVVATDNDQAFFRYQAGTDTTWVANYSIGNADTSTAVGPTVAVSTEYRLWVTIDSARRAHFFVNGAQLLVSTALTDATDFIPYIGVLSATSATAKSLVVRSCFISRNAA